MTGETAVVLVSAIMFGFGLGILATYLFAIKPLIDKLTNMRYDGFRPVEPIQRPKTVPPSPAFPRED